MNLPAPVLNAVANHKYPLLFATISGAHLYGFPSPDSDFDLRGVHVLPLAEIVGLSPGEETVEISAIEDSVELDLVTHDIKKFFLLLLKKNGYVLEQLYSPLVLKSSSAYEELKEIGKNCITRHHVHHYLGFADTQWKLFLKGNPPRVKPLLYVFRVLLTGIHLMRTGVVEANLLTLNEEFCLPYINDLVKQKTESKEKQTLSGLPLDFYQNEYLRLFDLLKEAGKTSHLPEAPTAKEALNDLLKRTRLALA